MPSKDKRFQSDNYYFKIDFGGMDYKSPYSLGTIVNTDSIKVVNPRDYFKHKTNCEVHTELSIYKRIYIVTDIPISKMNSEEGKSRTYIIFYTSYAGTLKDLTYVNPTGKRLIED